MSNAINQVIHPVQAPEQGAFSASRRADERGDLAFRKIHRDTVQGLLRAVEEMIIANADQGWILRGCGASVA